jgi:hypothetical protein
MSFNETNENIPDPLRASVLEPFVVSAVDPGRSI